MFANTAIFGASSNAGSAAMGILGLLMLMVGIVVAIALYMLPTIIVVLRKKKTNVGAIIALNFLAGWTFLGWLGSLIWALTSDPQPVILNANNVYQQPYPQQTHHSE